MVIVARVAMRAQWCNYHYRGRSSAKGVMDGFRVMTMDEAAKHAYILYYSMKDVVDGHASMKDGTIISTQDTMIVRLILKN